MITFKQFMREDNHATLTPLEAARYVVNNCQEFLHETNFKISHNENHASIASPQLYRGLGSMPFNTAYVLSGQRRRIPVDSSTAMTDTLDDYFKRRFGYEYRRYGVFCSGSMGFSSNYGNVFSIFPVDGYDSVWDKELEDAYTALDWSRGGDKPNFARRISEYMNVPNPFANYQFDETPPEVWDEWFKIVHDWLNLTKPYTDGDLIGGMTYGTKPEIMVKCKEYLAVPCRGVFMLEFTEELLELL